MKFLIPLLFLIVATTLESTGDALICKGLAPGALPLRLLLFASGGVLLFGYGLSLNLAPLEFNRVVGGALIVIGGLLVTFWQTPEATA